MNHKQELVIEYNKSSLQQTLPLMSYAVIFFSIIFLLRRFNLEVRQISN